MTVDDYTEIAGWAARRWASAGDREDAQQEALAHMLANQPDETRSVGEQRQYARRAAMSAVYRHNRRRWSALNNECSLQRRPDEVLLYEPRHDETPEALLAARDLDRAIRKAFREALAEMRPRERAYIMHAFGLKPPAGVPLCKVAGCSARTKLLAALGRGGVDLDRRLLYSGGQNPPVWGEYLAS